jgi:nicotinamidase-related amidase
MTTTKKIALLIIDAQFDFCSPEGTLYVPGAQEDMQRITALIEQKIDHIDQIIVTLDTHQVLDIAHPGFWENTKGESPPPFTPISATEVEQGVWHARFDKEYSIKYLRQLETQGEFQHFIWPEHCLIGTRGAALDDTLADALQKWSHQNQKNYKAIVKGENPLAEHFGVFRAQIPVPGEPKTELNQALLDDLEQYDELWVAGEARSHCVAASLKQILRYAPKLAPKVVILTDCMSDVTGLGHLADPIYAEALTVGVRFTTTTDLSHS